MSGSVKLRLRWIHSGVGKSVNTAVCVVCGVLCVVCVCSVCYILSVVCVLCVVCCVVSGVWCVCGVW